MNSFDLDELFQLRKAEASICLKDSGDLLPSLILINLPVSNCFNDRGCGFCYVLALRLKTLSAAVNDLLHAVGSIERDVAAMMSDMAMLRQQLYPCDKTCQNSGAVLV